MRCSTVSVPSLFSFSKIILKKVGLFLVHYVPVCISHFRFLCVSVFFAFLSLSYGPDALQADSQISLSPALLSLFLSCFFFNISFLPCPKSMCSVS